MTGCLGEETEAFVAEVERDSRDPVYWVRREASFALGALAKVVPQEIVICSLVGSSYCLDRIF
jgi:serine/threonine-protein phosphatase 4 regulatory subunit 1